MSKRLAFLEKAVEGGATDPMPWYALALEYAGLGRVDESVATFTKLRGLHPGYTPQYLMCGQVLSKAGRADAAREWLEEGLSTARAKGDAHAFGEIQEALAALG